MITEKFYLNISKNKSSKLKNGYIFDSMLDHSRTIIPKIPNSELLFPQSRNHSSVIFYMCCSVFLFQNFSFKVGYTKEIFVSFQKWIIFHKPTTNLFFAWLFARPFQSYISQVLKNTEFILWHTQFIVYARFI